MRTFVILVAFLKINMASHGVLLNVVNCLLGLTCQPSTNSVWAYLRLMLAYVELNEGNTNLRSI